MSNTSISLLELLVKGIPEGLLDVLAIFILTKTPFDKKKYLLISGIFITLTFFIRWLPINYGVNTMLSLLLLVAIFISIMKIDIAKLIKSIISVAIILIGCEGINIMLLLMIFGETKSQELLSTATGKSLFGIPSTILFAVVIIIANKIIRKKANKQLKNENIGTTDI